MRILFLTKQLYMGKDLLQDRFGRFYEIPKYLASCGNQVQVMCLKYRRTRNDRLISGNRVDDVQWNSFCLGWNWLGGVIRHYGQLVRRAEEFRPDVVVGASDSIHVILASSLSTRLGIPLVVDLYDDFESYPATQLPGIKSGLKRGINKALGISVVSENLAAKVLSAYKPSGLIRVITNAICPEIFRAADKQAARTVLGLPPNGLLIGTAGSLRRDRGISTLYEAFENLSNTIDNLYLVLAGARDRFSNMPERSNILYLGELPHHQIRDLFNALDVGLICNRKGDFATYCFPQKLYEMLACKLPVVAAALGPLPKLLGDSKQFLYDPDQPRSLVDAVSAQVSARYLPRIDIPTWRDQGILFNGLLENVARASRGDESPASSHQTGFSVSL